MSTTLLPRYETFVNLIEQKNYREAEILANAEAQKYEPFSDNRKRWQELGNSAYYELISQSPTKPFANVETVPNPRVSRSVPKTTPIEEEEDERVIVEHRMLGGHVMTGIAKAAKETFVRGESILTLKFEDGSVLTMRKLTPQNEREARQAVLRNPKPQMSQRSQRLEQRPKSRQEKRATGVFVTERITEKERRLMAIFDAFSKESVKLEEFPFNYSHFWNTQREMDQYERELDEELAMYKEQGITSSSDVLNKVYKTL